MKAFPLIQVEGSRYDIGFQYGRSCRERIEEFARGRLVREVEKRRGRKVIRQDLIAECGVYIEPTLRFYPEIAEEVRGVARGSGLSEEEIWLVQCHREIALPVTASGASSDGCTVFAVAPYRAVGEQTVAAKNCDKNPAFQDLIVLLEIHPVDGFSKIMCVIAGNVGSEGMNGNGLAYFGSGLCSDGSGAGVVSSVLQRALVDEPDVPTAITRLRQAVPRARPSNYLLADKSGRMVSVETTVDRDAEIHPADGFLAHTNHYLHPELSPFDTSSRFADVYSYFRSSHIRLERLLQLSAARNGARISVEDAKTWLSDHACGGDSICSHEGQGSMLATKTIASMVAVPASGEFHVSVGNGCSNGTYEPLHLQP